MWSLQNTSLLAPNGTVLLSHIPATVSLVPDPTAAGIFLHLQNPQPAAHWTTYVGIPTATRFAACYRNEPFWMRPAICQTAAQIPIETQILFAQLPPARGIGILPMSPVSSRLALFAPLIDGPNRCSLQGNPDGQLVLTIETGHPAITTDTATGLFIALQDPAEPLHVFLARAAAAVATHLNIKLRHEKSFPAFIDSFGWCTWDAFYHDVSPQKIREGLTSFQTAGVPPKFLILDDGWQSETDHGNAKGRRLMSFAPNEKFSPDLAPTIRMAKQEFGIAHFLVWHALQGYWAGVDTEKFAAYRPRETPRAYSAGMLHHFPQANTQWGASAGIVPPHEAEHFFRDYHAALAAQGVDGVKVDNQAALEALAGPFTLGRNVMHAHYRAALEASARAHFQKNMLHCMSCGNDLLYAQGETALTRTSTDFWPAKPETHGLHLWTNAIVALWFSHFVHPDWDMFQSALPGPHEKWSAFHAAARAISGGPVYVSDKPGQHDAALLKKLVLSDGRIARCPEPAVICGDCLFADLTREPVLLKIRNTVPRAAPFPRAGIIGLFNCHYNPGKNTPPISGNFSPADIPEIAGWETYAVYLHNQNRHLLASFTDVIAIHLNEGEFELATIVPVREGIAPLGLREKFNMCATISPIAETGGGLLLEARDGGELVVYCQTHPTSVLLNAQTLPFSWKDSLLAVKIPSAGKVTLHFNPPH